MSDRVQQMVAGALGAAPESITDDLAMFQMPSWDSMKHMEIIVGLEREFGVELTFDEIVEMRSVADIRRVLAARGKG